MYTPPYPNLPDQPNYPGQQPVPGQLPYAGQPPYPSQSYYQNGAFVPPQPMPVYATKKTGIRGWVVALIAVGTFLLGLVGGCSVGYSAGLFSLDERQSGFWNNYDDNYDSPNYYGNGSDYSFGETASIEGSAYDLAFSPCTYRADITLTSYLRGSDAESAVLAMGGDVSGIAPGKEYVAATFQVKLNETDTSSAVLFNPQYFRFDISESYDDPNSGNYPDDGAVIENLTLKAGESGQITAYAVIDENLDDPTLTYYSGTEDEYEFSPDR